MSRAVKIWTLSIVQASVAFIIAHNYYDGYLLRAKIKLSFRLQIYFMAQDSAVKAVILFECRGDQ